MVRPGSTNTAHGSESPSADFAFYIDFRKGKGPAARVFAATHAFIQACEQIDRELVSSIDTTIETVLVIEDIEAGSLKTWLRYAINSIDDQALKDINWKPLIGQFLVKAKYMVLKWIDNNDAHRDLPKLGRELQKLAAETDVRHLGDYPPVNPQALVSAIRNFEGIKDHLLEGDKASVITPGNDDIDFDLTFRFDLEMLEELAIKEIRKHTVPRMVFIVRKPDYLGTSMWELRHGKTPISAKIEDERWLATFQDRGVDVRPGDALQCRARIEMTYGFDNELISEKFYLEEVQEVLENQYTQNLLPYLDDDEH